MLFYITYKPNFLGVELKNKNLFKSSVFNEEDQKYLIDQISEIKVYKGELENSDICFIQK